MKILAKFLCYIGGIRIKPQPTFSNDGPSSHTWVLASCHPLDSITWHWTVWCRTPKLSLRWLFNPGISIHTQKLMRKK